MNLTSTRAAIHDALAFGFLHQGGNGLREFLTYETKIDKSVRNHDNCADFLEAGYICAAITKLPPPVAGWLHFCYGPDDRIDLETQLARALQLEMFPGFTPKKRTRMVELGKVTLEDYRLRLWQEKTLTIEYYSLRLGIFRQHFVRDWEAKKNQYLNKIKSWDANGVGEVSRVVRALRGESEETASQVLQN